ncbi:unnamed protein product [Clavelina lepadiformis]|uniref:HECT-type E3 ubiquitin transferase n=1 Tax=Clavelina lepadiformis TaxID=159417 RepID=A0ABP0GBE6_CLALP
MYSFEGNFRSTPNVSLGGKSKQKTAQSSTLIANKARVERQKREAARQELHSSLILQSSIRSFLVRQKLKKEFRQKFDEDKQHQQLTEEQCHQSIRLICYFFDVKLTADIDRLIWICQKFHQFKSKGIKHNMAYLLSQLLVLCTRCLLKDASTSIPAMPLRMIETFTAAKYWRAQEVFLWQRLINQDFFPCMLHIFQKKVPIDIEPHDDQYKSPHLVLADSLLNILKRPLNFVSRVLTTSISTNNELNNTVQLILSRFTTDVLSHQVTLQIHNFILPSLMKDSTFPTCELVTVIERTLSNAADNKIDRPLSPNIYLLSAVVQLLQDSLDSVPNHVVLTCFQHLVPMLCPVGGIEMQEDDMSDEEEDPYDVDMLISDNDISTAQLLSECLQFLNSPSFIDNCVKPVLYQLSSVLPLCEITFHLMSRLKLPIITTRFVYSLAFSSPFLKVLWSSIITSKTNKHNSVSSQLSIRVLLDGGHITESYNHHLMTQLITFCALFSHNLLSLHDVDFYGTEHSTFGINELSSMVITLKDISLSLVKKILPETRWKLENYDVREVFQRLSAGKQIYHHSRLSNEIAVNVENAALAFKVCSRLLNQLHTRHARRPFTKDDVWLSHSTMIGSDRSKYLSSNWRRRRLGNDNIAAHMADPSDEDLPMTVTEARQLTILTSLPFVVPFETRIFIFTSMLSQDRVARESTRDVLMQDAGFADSSSVIQVKVRRNFLYEDAFNDLSQSNAPDLRRVLRVTFVNPAGADEAGYGGGVTREFLQQLVKTAFEPARGLFKITGESELYPNPHAGSIVDNVQQHFNFLGRLLGKILYEGMQIELPFAAFFLSKLLCHKNSDVDINHLQSLDPDFYKNLMFLRSYDGDVAELDLNFTVVDDSFGETKVTELVRGGHDISVTNKNRVRYIHLLSNYKLNVQMRLSCDAFRNGLSSVVPLEWIRMFDHRELQTLISGPEIAINVADMKINAAFSGGYKAEDQTIKLFWEVLSTFSEEEKRKLLLFVTSCSRPPLLGFKEMQPPFCVHNGGTADRLPTSATCLNLLRLPQYTDAETMRNKLIYCIDSQSGFELS